MIFVLIGAAVLAVLVTVGRLSGRRAQTARTLWALVSVAAAGAAVFVGLRGGWVISLALVAVSLYLARRSRAPAPVRAGYVPRSPPVLAPSDMSRREACEILGVGESASRAEVEAAYRRLMMRAHPDHGGSAGLAAKLNAARDVLSG